MTSLQTSIKQIPSDGGYFMTVGSLADKVYAYNATATPPFTVASFAVSGAGGGGKPLSSISTAGGVLRDMGKTVVSSLRTFRKVQLVVKNDVATPSTFGVGGPATAGQEYFTGYIELGFEGYGDRAPVAQFGR
jgi:hypothetical protein